MRLHAGLLSMLAAAFTAGTLWAGGSGFNVIVIVNQNSTDSVQLANDYCEKRDVPPQNVFRMTNWTGGAIEWSRNNFEACLRFEHAGVKRYYGGGAGTYESADEVLLAFYALCWVTFGHKAPTGNGGARIEKVVKRWRDSQGRIV